MKEAQPSPTPLKKKVDDVRSSVKWQLKKVTNMNTAIANEEMDDEQIRQNIVMAMNFLASLLKKQWHNIKSINIKCTMGKASKILWSWSHIKVMKIDS